MRMNEEVYLELLSKVSPYIQRRDTQLRKAITAYQRLSTTHRFLATGNSCEDLNCPTRISPQALGRFIQETCDVIYRVLQSEYIKVKTRGQLMPDLKHFHGLQVRPHVCKLRPQTIKRVCCASGALHVA